MFEDDRNENRFVLMIFCWNKKRACKKLDWIKNRNQSQHWGGKTTVWQISWHGCLGPFGCVQPYIFSCRSWVKQVPSNHVKTSKHVLNLMHSFNAVDLAEMIPTKVTTTMIFVTRSGANNTYVSGIIVAHVFCEAGLGMGPLAHEKLRYVWDIRSDTNFQFPFSSIPALWFFWLVKWTRWMINWLPYRQQCPWGVVIVCRCVQVLDVPCVTEDEVFFRVLCCFKVAQVLISAPKVLGKCETTIWKPLPWRFWALRRCHRKCSGRVRHVSYEGQHVNISPCVWKLSYCYAGWRKGFTASSHQPVGQHWQWQGICAHGGSRVSFWWISLMNCKEDGTRCETKLRFLSFESNAK